MNLVDMSDGDLIEELARRVAKQISDTTCHYVPVGIQIRRRIRRHFGPTTDDIRLIIKFIRLVRKMDREDLDMAHQSNRVTQLGDEFVSIKDQLMQRMSGQQREIRTIA